MKTATIAQCANQNCQAEYTATKKYPGPHCPTCTDRYLATMYTDRGLRLPATRTTKR